MESNRDISAIFESITDAFFSLDREWRFTYLNSEAERVLFRKREELLGKNVWDEFPEAVGLRFYREYHKAMDERMPGSVSLWNDAPSLQVVAADEQLEAAIVHMVRLGERERLSNEARKPLT